MGIYREIEVQYVQKLTEWGDTEDQFVQKLTEWGYTERPRFNSYRN